MKIKGLASEGLEEKFPCRLDGSGNIEGIEVMEGVAGFEDGIDDIRRVLDCCLLAIKELPQATFSSISIKLKGLGDQACSVKFKQMYTYKWSNMYSRVVVSGYETLRAIPGRPPKIDGL